LCDTKCVAGKWALNHTSAIDARATGRCGYLGSEIDVMIKSEIGCVKQPGQCNRNIFRIVQILGASENKYNVERKWICLGLVKTELTKITRYG
jgi:hypothetical protein